MRHCKVVTRLNNDQTRQSVILLLFLKTYFSRSARNVFLVELMDCPGRIVTEQDVATKPRRLMSLNNCCSNIKSFHSTTSKSSDNQSLFLFVTDAKGHSDQFR
jgi:hypothetical protein